MDKLRLLEALPGHFGFSSHLLHALLAIYLSEKDGIPLVIDFSKNHSFIQKDGENVWDNYFEQPWGISLSEARELASQNKVELLVVRGFCNSSEFNAVWACPNSINYYVIDSKIRDRGVNAAKRIRPRGETKELIDSFFEKNMLGHKVIGVHRRGSVSHMHGEPILPTKEFFDMIDHHLCSEQGFDRIFLATNEIEQVDKFKSKYEDKLLLQDNVLRLPHNVYLNTNEYSETNKDLYRLGREVAVDIFLLSKTDLLIRTFSGLSAMVIFLNGDLVYIQLNQRFYR